MYMGSIDLKNAFNRVSGEAFWQILRVNDVWYKLFGVIKIVYVDSLACVRVKGGKSELFRIDSGVR